MDNTVKIVSALVGVGITCFGAGFGIGRWSKKTDDADEPKKAKEPAAE